MFEVVAGGTPPFQYQWRNNGISMAGETNAFLRFDPVQIADAGDYSVVITGPGGAVTSQVVTLALLPTLSLSSVGPGTVEASPSKAFYGLGESVTLTAAAARWHAFTRWNDGSTVNPRSIAIGYSNAYTAIFSPTTAVETLTFGDVTRFAPVGMPAVLVDGQFIPTGAVTRAGSAQVALHTTFTNGTLLYTLDGSAPGSFSTLYQGPFVVQRSVTIRAVAFDARFSMTWESDPVGLTIDPLFNLVATTVGGGTIVSDPPLGPFLSNTVVRLIATPAPGWSLLQWLGDVSGNATTNPISLTRDTRVEAVFGTPLSVLPVGNGTVVVHPAAAFYPYGYVVRLSAVPAAGHGFALWGDAVSSTNNPLRLTITNAHPSISCLFVPLEAGQVTLSVLENGPVE